MNKTQAGRLLTLAYFLKTQVPAKHFDLSWFIHTDGPAPLIPLSPDGSVCGTAACALGWCPTVFPRQWRWNHGVPICYSEEEFFGASEHERMGLFYSNDFDRTPKQEAAVIERVVRRHGWDYA